MVIVEREFPRQTGICQLRRKTCVLKAWDKTSAVDVGQEGRVLRVKIELKDETRAERRFTPSTIYYTAQHCYHDRILAMGFGR